MEGVWSYLRRKPLQRRVTVMLTVAVALAILLSNVAGYVALRATLVKASQSIAMSIAQDLTGPAAASIRQSGQLSAEVHQAGGVIVEAVSPDGVVVRVPGESQELVLEPGDLEAAVADGPTSRRTGVDAAGQPYVVVSTPLGTTGYALVVARPLSTILGILQTERLILLCVIAAGILAAAVISGFVARSSLRPVRQLTAAVEHVTDTKD
ncbi:MAG: hypothetical protein EOP01_05680, partial [Propionibacteriaceae bacterium]